MSETRSEFKDRLDRLLSLLEREQQQMAMIFALLERTLNTQSNFGEELGKIDKKEQPELPTRSSVGNRTSQKSPGRIDGLELRSGFIRIGRFLRRTPSAAPPTAFVV